jgi:hypothetical protein
MIRNVKSGLEGCGGSQPVGNTADRRATADHNASGTDEKGSDNGHHISAHDAGEDNSVRGVETHIDDRSDVSFWSRMRKENHHKKSPWGFANVST